MVLLDVDDFEALNERSNFALGDLLLTCLAGLILAQIRAIDIAGRYHGEKFLLFLPETDLDGAAVFTRRIQGQLGQIAASVAQETLSFSAGIVPCAVNCGNFASLAEQAEAAMRAAKAEKPGAFKVWEEGIGAAT